MGWWHPYFFVELEGVQLLFSAFEIGGTATFLLYSVLLAALCACDRFAAAKAATLKRHPQRECAAVGWWTVQRLSGGLVMLVMMSFNLVLFAETVAFLGAAELWMVRSGRAMAHHHAFAPVATTDDVEHGAER